jgi:hypothetical protein
LSIVAISALWDKEAGVIAGDAIWRIALFGRDDVAIPAVELGTSRVPDTVAVCAVDVAVAVVVGIIVANFGGTSRISRAIRVGAVDIAICVIVCAVIADLNGCLACWVCRAVGVVAVDVTIAVVVDAILAIFGDVIIGVRAAREEQSQERGCVEVKANSHGTSVLIRRGQVH